MNEFARELQEDLNREKTQAFWHKYGIFIIAIVMVSIISAVGYIIWQNNTRDEQIILTGQLIAIGEEFQKSNFADTETKAQALIKEAPDTAQAALAAYRAAAANVQMENYAGALNDFIVVIDHNDASPELRSLATLGARQIVQIHGVKSERDFVLASGSPFYVLQQEMDAWQYAKAGNKAEAALLFNSISESADALPSQRQRAQDMAAYFAPPAGLEEAGTAEE